MAEQKAKAKGRKIGRSARKPKTGRYRHKAMKKQRILTLIKRFQVPTSRVPQQFPGWRLVKGVGLVWYGVEGKKGATKKA